MSSKNKSNSNNQLINFTPPRRHDGKQSYISFEITDPITGKLKRKKYMLDKYKVGKERDVMAAQIMSNIYYRLMQGWNPWLQAPSTRGNISLLNVLRNYRIYLRNLHSKKVITDKTRVDWHSRARILETYIQEYHLQRTMAYEVDKQFAVGYLDYILLDRDVSATTRNNHRAWLSTFCNWMKERNYIEDNPVADIPLLPEHAKYREALPASALKKLSSYLYENDKYFLMAVMMEYYTFIRPTELTNIKLRDINISEQSVFVSGAVSKNRKDGKVALNDKILRLMLELGILSKPVNYFLFGKKMYPSERQATAAIFRLKFAAVREALHFPDTYQFYSLKDSGIRDLANAEGIVRARDQARHSDISTTNRYLKGKDKKVDEDTKHFEGNI